MVFATQVLVQLFHSQLVVVGKSTNLCHITISIKRTVFKGRSLLKTDDKCKYAAALGFWNMPEFVCQFWFSLSAFMHLNITQLLWGWK